MKNYLAVLFIVFSFYSVFGQNVTRQIDWIQPSDSTYSGPMATFKGAIVTDQGLPIYQEIIDLDGSAKRVRITRMVFASLSQNVHGDFSTLKDTLIVTPKYIRGKGKNEALLNFVPIIYKNGRYQKLVSFDIEKYTTKEKSAIYQQGTDWKKSSVLANGYWVKIRTSDAGIYKITYNTLKNWGFTDPSSVRLYGNGGYLMPKMNDDFFYDDLQQDAVLRAKDGDGNDCIFFYSTGTVRWKENGTSGEFSQQLNDYSDYAYYFLSDQDNEKSVGEMAEVTGDANATLTSFNEHAYHELEQENLIKSGRRWFGEKFIDGQSKTVSLSLDDIDSNQPAKVDIVAAGRSSNSSKLNVSINSSSRSSLSFLSVDTGSGTAWYAKSDEKNYVIDNPSDNLTCKLSYVAGSTSAMAWLDYLTVNYRRNLVVNDQLQFRDRSNVGAGNISQFNLTVSGSNLKIWDVTDYTTPVSVPFSQNGNSASFKANADQLHEYVGFYTDANLPQPEFVEEVKNQNLHEILNADMVIVSAPEFLTEANELAQFHRDHDQLSVSVVTPGPVYNEFSGGAPDVAGIRNFLKMQYDRSGSMLKYVLLFGDGSYDNKNIKGDATNFILTYQSPNSLLPTSSFVTDDFYALLDDGEGEYTGKIDLGIGRIPANTETEAKIAVDKTKHYASHNTFGDWRDVICFIGDDEDSNTHMRQANDLATMVNESSPA
ncbi:MAG TPA: type IX secretion system sortase PorU, partial [Sunxiuqinia sp.]|nr:type IX secretion system sortase PorU [Sunxiuqinia sp.]